jgi:DNA-binding response OmpR family regulator
MNAAISVQSSVQSSVHPVADRRHFPAPALAPRAARRRILIVEKDVSVRQLLRLHLSLAGFDIEEAVEGTAGLERARSEKFDLIVLDVIVPGLDGITVCRAIRAQSVNMASAVLILTARGSEADKVLGLESGADDYLTKPFSIREMVARVGAILRRCDRVAGSTGATAPRDIRVGDISIDPERREAVVRGSRVEVTKQEFDLLYLLAARPGIVFSRTALLKKIWTDETNVTERTVDTVISRLRRKIEHHPQRPQLILTAWGVGYKFIDAER